MEKWGEDDWNRALVFGRFGYFREEQQSTTRKAGDFLFLSGELKKRIFIEWRKIPEEKKFFLKREGLESEEKETERERTFFSVSEVLAGAS